MSEYLSGIFTTPPSSTQRPILAQLQEASVDGLEIQGTWVTSEEAQAILSLYGSIREPKFKDALLAKPIQVMVETVLRIKKISADRSISWELTG